MLYNVGAIAAAHLLKDKDANVLTEVTDIARKNYHYYDLVIKKFFKFPVIKVATNEFPDYKIKTINSQTLWVSQHWFFHDEDCEAKPINYIKENLEKYLTFDIWNYFEKDVIQKYLEAVKSDYNITLDESKLIYDVKIAWVVDMITEDERLEILSSNSTRI